MGFSILATDTPYTIHSLALGGGCPFDFSHPTKSERSLSGYLKNFTRREDKIINDWYRTNRWICRVRVM